MASSRPSGVAHRGRRRWTFGDCVFDEANWLLTVGGGRAQVETKPLELLRALLLRAGDVVSKDELLDAIWPDVTVVEASLPTAVRKLRLAMGDDRRDRPIIETVSGIGYRFAVPVAVEGLDMATGATLAAIVSPVDESGTVHGTAAGQPSRARRRSLLFFAGALAIASVALALSLAPSAPPSAAAAPRSVSRTDVFTALRKIDVAAIEAMLAAGWDPNAPLDIDRNGALNTLVNNCEWDPGHDQRRMLLAARTLVDGGARVTDRNAWGDTTYSIAKADRYCGPDHPVTKMIHMICYQGGNPVGDRCLADYRRDPSGKVTRQ